jgi:hypothetical protein
VAEGLVLALFHLMVLFDGAPRRLAVAWGNFLMQSDDVITFSFSIFAPDSSFGAIASAQKLVHLPPIQRFNSVVC